jgi:ABC-type glycerol-3-phosphate transport system permease component
VANRAAKRAALRVAKRAARRVARRVAKGAAARGAQRGRGAKGRPRLKRLARWLPGALIGALVLAIAFPLYWAVASSITPESRLFGAPSLFPDRPVLDHYRALFDERNFWVPIRNSLIVAGTTTLLSVMIGGLAAYALARLRFRGKAPLLAFILAVSMFPQIAIVSPLYIVLRELRLINTYPGLVLPYLTFAMPLTIWLLVGFFRQLPAELEEAGLMDGAGRLRILREIILPVSLPGLATTAILTFLYSWNEFLFALSFTLGPERYTVPVAIALFRGQYQVPWGQILAGAVVATIPVALIVLLFQRRIVQGLTAGAVKG